MLYLTCSMIPNVDLACYSVSYGKDSAKAELQWLEHLWNHRKMFEGGVNRANELIS